MRTLALLLVVRGRLRRWDASSPTSGAQKVAGLLLAFLTKDSTARSWFG